MKNMKKFIFFLIILFFLSTVFNPFLIQAQENVLEVSVLGSKKYEVSSGEIVTIPFKVINTGSKTGDFTGELNLPLGWRPISGESPFTLDPGEDEIQIIGFFVPDTALAGNYEISYLVKERELPSISDSKSMIVTVLPFAKLKVEVIKVPQYVVAGEDYQSSFMINNGGNIPLTVGLEIVSGNDFPASTDELLFQLIPGEARNVVVTVKTDEMVQRELRHLIEMNARVMEAEYNTVTATDSSWVKIIPRITEVEDPIHKIPVKLKLSGAMEVDETTGGSLQAELTGRGTLDEEGAKHLDFFFRLPGIPDWTLSGQWDEYHISYWTDTFELSFGDRGYSLSPLTVMYHYGRGVEGKLNMGTFELGGYYRQSRWVDPSEEELAAYLHYDVMENQKIGVNYLENKGENPYHIWSAQASLEPIDENYLELEYASGEKLDSENGNFSEAYRIRNHGTFLDSGIHYWLESIYAQPDFPGPYRDTQSLSAGINIPLFGHFQLTAYGFQQTSNLAPDLSRPIPSREGAQISLSYQSEEGTTFSLRYQKTDSQDLLPEPGYHDREDTLRLNIGHSFEKFSFYGTIDLGEEYDYLSGEQSDANRYGISASWQPTKGQRYSGYLRFGDFYDYTGTGDYRRSMNAGLSCNFQITDRTSFSASLQMSNRYSPYSQFNLNHRFSNGHNLLLLVENLSFCDSVQDKDTKIKLEYTIPFDVPLGRKQSIGGLKGQIYDLEEDSRGIADVILEVKGATAITDENGEFSFPSLKPGIYYLGVYKASIGLERVIVPKVPIEVEVEGGKDIEVNLGVIRSASVSGTVYAALESNNDNSGKNGEDAGKLQGMENILVELSDGQETLRNITDRKGYFGFEELIPGKWILKIHTYNLSRFHYLEKDTFDFELAPGEKKEMLVKVLVKKPDIQFIEGGEIILEEKKQ